MRGINKLILTLFFMILFGVGFRIEAKAAYQFIPPDIEVKQDNDGNISWILTLLAEDDGKNSFPQNEGETYTYSYHLDGALDGSDTCTLELYILIRSGRPVYYYKVNGNPYSSVSQNTILHTIYTMDKKDVKDQLEPKDPTPDDEIRSFNFNITPTGKNPDSIDNTTFSPRLVKSYRVNTITPIPNGPEVTYEPSDGYIYLLPNEKTVITAKSEAVGKTVEANGKENAYRWADSWERSNTYVNPPKVLNSDESESKVEVTMGSSPQGATDIYPKIGTVTMKFKDDITTDVELSPGDPLPQRQITVLGTDCEAYTKSDATVTINGVEVNNLVWSGGTFSFDVNPNTPTKSGPSDLDIVMNDGNIFHRNLMITAPETLTVTVEQNIKKAGTVSVRNERTKNEGKSVIAEEGNTITITAKANEGYEFDEWVVRSGEADIETESEKTSFVMGDKSVIIEAIFSEDSSSTISPIQVTLGQSVPLTRFLKGSASQYVSGNVSTGYISPSKFSNTANKVNLTGEIVTPTTAGVKDLDLNGTDVTVHVFRLPDFWFETSSWGGLSLNSSNSSSSSSSNSAFKVIMPTNVAYGEKVGYSVSKAGVLLSGSRGSKYASLNVSSDSSESVPSKSASADIMSVTSILKDICSGSRDTLAIEVRPINASGEWEPNADISDIDAINVYRVDLDGSAGATYKVNDKDVGDYFYAIDGFNYKISATNKSGYTSTIEKWEGVNFGTSTSGTASFTGSKTVKAFFKSSTSSSSSSSSARSSSSSSSSKTTAPGGGPGTGGDYDDVPKTGESKTDIWILWSVLFISILGAGFMIYKRFGLVKAIARAEEEAALVEREERVEAEKKEKKEKMDLLKSLRDL